MTKSLDSSADKQGLPPGSLVHVGEIKQNKNEISAFAYSKTALHELPLKSIEELQEYIDKDSVVWVNVTGLNNITLIKNIGKLFSIHSLVLEDIMNTHQRVKFDDYQNYLFFVLKNLSLNSTTNKIDNEQISILLVKNFVFTFNEQGNTLFNPLKQRLSNSDSKLRQKGTDFLLYALMDCIVDQYFILTDGLDEILERIDDDLMLNPTINTQYDIQAVKRQLISTKKTVLPLREALSAILRADSSLIKNKTHIYFRDVYDHLIRISESLDSYRELVSGSMDIYLSSVSNKMNAIMKVLTVFASIFIPLTFIAGVYGMNFEYMPELKLKWAYPTLWCVFIIIIIFQLIFFKRKKWL